MLCFCGICSWVAEATDSDVKFLRLDEDDNEIAMEEATGKVYYCGDEDDGHAKKNKWTKTWPPDNTSEEDDDKEWFWFDKDGVLFRSGENKGSATASDAWKYKLDEGTLKKDANESTGVISKKKVNSKDYWSTKDGVLLSKFYLINDAMYYFGGSDDGSLVLSPSRTILVILISSTSIQKIRLHLTRLRMVITVLARTLV